MARLVIEGTRLIVGGDRALIHHPISLHIEDGFRLGIIGPNGAGKTTLLEALAGKRDLEATTRREMEGTLLHLGQDAVWEAGGASLLTAVLDGRPEIGEALSALERHTQAMAGSERDQRRLQEILDTIDRLDAWTWEARARAALTGVGFREKEINEPMSRFSGGERHRALLARAVTSSASILILDEPTNHLDVWATGWLAKTLPERGGLLVFASHDRFLLDRVATHILDLSGEDALLYRGNYTAYLAQRDMREKTLERQSEREARERAELQAYIDRYRAGNRAAMAKSRQKRLERMGEVRHSVRQGPRAIHLGPAARRGRIEIEDLVVGWDRPILGPLSLRLEPGYRLGLLGRNGAGKSTLLKTLSGEIPALGGTVTGMDDLRLAVFGQDLSNLPSGRTALEAVMGLGLPDEEARRRLAEAGFGKERVDTLVEQLSGGERNRLTLLFLNLSAPDVLILDEPTNHLDIEGRLGLEAALGSYDGTVILASHDRTFLSAVGARLPEITEGGEIRETDLAALEGKVRTPGRSLEELEEDLRKKEAERERCLSALAGPAGQRGPQRRQMEARLGRTEEEIAHIWQEIEDLG